ncbi:hypothetical protein OS493_037560, partial [Desmophyllum pertusum]
LARNITITNLNLCDNSISNAGTESLARMLKNNCFITQLDVSENRLGAKGVERFGEMLNENACLQNLGLANCGLHERDIPKLLQAGRILSLRVHCEPHSRERGARAVPVKTAVCTMQIIGKNLNLVFFASINHCVAIQLTAQL